MHLLFNCFEINSLTLIQSINIFLSTHRGRHEKEENSYAGFGYLQCQGQLLRSSAQGGPILEEQELSRHHPACRGFRQAHSYPQRRCLWYFSQLELRPWRHYQPSGGSVQRVFRGVRSFQHHPVQRHAQKLRGHCRS